MQRISSEDVSHNYRLGAETHFLIFKRPEETASLPVPVSLRHGPSGDSVSVAPVADGNTHTLDGARAGKHGGL